MRKRLGMIAVALCGAVALPGPGTSIAHAEDRVTVLYDAFGKPSDLKKDWGFSALVEVNGKRILFDTGNNAGIFAHNVKARGVDLNSLDFAVISHRHGDHIGGLSHLLRVNPDVKIYAPEEGFGVFGFALPGTFYPRNESLPREQRYFDGDPPEMLHFGTAWPEGNFTLVGETAEVASGFHLIALPGAWGADPPVMELSLAIDTPEGIVLVVGCSHPTIEKIVEAARAAIDKPIHLVIGGTHLLPADEQEIQRIAAALRDTWKVNWIAPAHCTGEPAFEILKDIFGDRYVYAGLGATLGLEASSVAGADMPHAFYDAADLRTYRALGIAERLHHDYRRSDGADVPGRRAGLSLTSDAKCAGMTCAQLREYQLTGNAGPAARLPQLQ
ncbi:MAG: MBL fold metallo-hydrolase [Gammaproteobacteria bacterium]